jgi:hypothetical protein
MRYASSRHSSSRLGPSAPGGKRPPPRISCHRARKIGVRRSNSTQSASSLLAKRSSGVPTVAAMRNLAGRRFSATSRYHDSAPRIAGSCQIVSLAKSLMDGPASSIFDVRACWGAFRFALGTPAPTCRRRPLSKRGDRSLPHPICLRSAGREPCGSDPQGACSWSPPARG